MRLILLLAAVSPCVASAQATLEPLVRADLLFSCAYLTDGSIVCSGEGDTNREIRLVSPDDLQARPAEGLWFAQRRFVTWGMTPLPFGEGKLLFVRRGAQEGGLWTWDLATSQEVQVRRDPFMGLPPAISADGSLILAYRWAGRSRRIGLVDPQTGKFSSVPGKDMSSPALSPDGSRLLFIREGQVWLRSIVDPLKDDESRDVQLTHCDLPCSWPVWGPDAHSLAFVCAEPQKPDDETAPHGKVGWMSAEGGVVAWIAEDLSDPRCPAFSPDGAWLIFLAKEQAKPFDDVIWRARLHEPGQ